MSRVSLSKALYDEFCARQTERTHGRQKVVSVALDREWEKLQPSSRAVWDAIAAVVAPHVKLANWVSDNVLDLLKAVGDDSPLAKPLIAEVGRVLARFERALEASIARDEARHER